MRTKLILFALYPVALVVVVPFVVLALLVCWPLTLTKLVNFEL